MDRFVPYVQSHVPGCPVSWINRALLSAGIEFCRDTLVYQEDATVSILVGSDTIIVYPPENTKILLINKIDIHGINVAEIKLDRGRAEIKTSPPASEDQSGKIFMTLAPNRIARELPDLLFDSFFNAIKSGALATLMNMQGRNWYDPGLAALHQKRFLHEKELAKLMENKKYFPNMTVRQRPWV